MIKIFIILAVFLLVTTTAETKSLQIESENLENLQKDVQKFKRAVIDENKESEIISDAEMEEKLREVKKRYKRPNRKWPKSSGSGELKATKTLLTLMISIAVINLLKM